jgi:hypothetical protein
MYTDTFFKDKVSARGYTCAQLFVTAEGFIAGKPLKTKSDAYTVLEHVCRKYGVPRLLVSDGAKEERLGEWGRIVKQNLIPQSNLLPNLIQDGKIGAKMKLESSTNITSEL